MSDFSCTHPLQLLGLTLHWREDASCSTRDAFWDAFQSWCDRQSVYPGGNSAQVFILSSKAPLRLQSALTRWLKTQPGLARFDIASVPLDIDSDQHVGANASPIPTLSPCIGSHLPAALEALGNYQQHLIEEFQQAAQLLPRLSAASRGQMCQSRLTVAY